MQTEDKLKEIYEGMLEEAPGKGFTLTCNKCGATVQLIKNQKVKGRGIMINMSSQENEEGYSDAGIWIQCNKCKTEWEMDEANMA